MKRMWLFWVLAIVITLMTAYYQRVTGPTHPKRIKITLNGNEHSFTLPRSHPGETDCSFDLDDLTSDVSEIRVHYRRFPTSEEFTTVQASIAGGKVALSLPNQPPAGKLQYFLEITDKAGNTVFAAKDENIVIRFRGDVPAFIMIPHIFLMFAAMLLSNLTGLLVIGKKKKYRFYMVLTVIVLMIGGMFFGPVMQKYAFGEFWTGVPFGWDLTDNKTLIAVTGWVFALLLNIRKERPWASLVAAILLFVIYSIPHSMMGSELDYSTGQVTTGYILFNLF